ncbi:hypothetical protein Tco_1249838 [Tanacetum coccineum]
MRLHILDGRMLTYCMAVWCSVGQRLRLIVHGIHCIRKFPSIYIQLFWNTLTHDAKTGRSLLHDIIGSSNWVGAPKPDLALELGKSISLTEAEEEVYKKGHATHARLCLANPDPMQKTTGSNSGKYMCPPLLLDQT